MYLEFHVVWIWCGCTRFFWWVEYIWQIMRFLFVTRLDLLNQDLGNMGVAASVLFIYLFIKVVFCFCPFESSVDVAANVFCRGKRNFFPTWSYSILLHMHE
eukprot:TRINITY_DN8210_c1_g1_i1.p1 TRINITY_DN8210_c1_g1~~TRINITY_DN8210_c1_g1_i1.p1  ORF type:complete len:101 (+),score=1.84 TRINITY_DN8210_c1_g1_i1:698-1000(+)